MYNTLANSPIRAGTITLELIFSCFHWTKQVTRYKIGWQNITVLDFFDPKRTKIQRKKGHFFLVLLHLPIPAPCRDHHYLLCLFCHKARMFLGYKINELLLACSKISVLVSLEASLLSQTLTSQTISHFRTIFTLYFSNLVGSLLLSICICISFSNYGSAVKFFKNKNFFHDIELIVDFSCILGQAVVKGLPNSTA